METLTVEEIYQREILQKTCDKGEAACLVLAKRYQGQAVFLSSDKKACQVAKELDIPYLTVPDILEAWVKQKQPTIEEFDALVKGMRAANFDPDTRDAKIVVELRRRLER